MKAKTKADPKVDPTRKTSLLTPKRSAENREIPQPLFIVFCRICGVETLATDQLAAAQLVLLRICEEVEVDETLQVWAMHSSVYGRFVACRTAAAALDVAQRILLKTAEQGVRLAIGVAGEGRIELFDDLGMRPNLIGIPINTAARLAFSVDSENSIVVEVYVVQEAQEQRSEYKNRFDREHSEQVKQTQLRFRVLKYSAKKFGHLKKRSDERETQVTVAVYDIVRYSEMDVEKAWQAVNGLREEVVGVLESEPLGGRMLVEQKKLWYSPAGDGGVLVFSADQADKAFELVENLAKNCRQKGIEIRLAVSDGTVVIIGDNLPVGKGIVSTDKLCGHPATWQICARKTYFNGLPKTVRERWVTLDFGAHQSEPA